MNGKITVCFVCTENIGRSLSAEYCLKKYLEDENIDDIEVISAATTGAENDVTGYCFSHFEELKNLGIDISQHKRKPLTQELVNKSDIIIAMSQKHQEWIKENYGIYAPMFTELVEGEKRSIIIPSPSTEECDPFMRNMVHYFYQSMPKIVTEVRNRTSRNN